MPLAPPRHQPRRAGARRHEGRPTAARRLYGYAWQKARAAFLREHPLCAECQKENRVTVATVVDHVTPHRGDPELFWDRSNWRPLCKRHHDRKTATEDGGFGNDPSPGGDRGSFF